MPCGNSPSKLVEEMKEVIPLRLRLKEVAAQHKSSRGMEGMFLRWQNLRGWFADQGMVQASTNLRKC